MPRPTGRARRGRVGRRSPQAVLEGEGRVVDRLGKPRPAEAEPGVDEGEVGPRVEEPRRIDRLVDPARGDDDPAFREVAEPLHQENGRPETRSSS
jgi:hypothetical protein